MMMMMMIRAAFVPPNVSQARLPLFHLAASKPHPFVKFTCLAVSGHRLCLLAGWLALCAAQNKQVVIIVIAIIFIAASLSAY